mmetsp:Transcript_15876/g.23580  ORF Transcript_15876/g.23580 Transcript_15876/m.23580 type:complete len:231 (+) Transcript_15876:168-860(+)
MNTTLESNAALVLSNLSRARVEPLETRSTVLEPSEWGSPCVNYYKCDSGEFENDFCGQDRRDYHRNDSYRSDYVRNVRWGCEDRRPDSFSAIYSPSSNFRSLQRNDFSKRETRNDITELMAMLPVVLPSSLKPVAASPSNDCERTIDFYQTLPFKRKETAKTFNCHEPHCQNDNGDPQLNSARFKRKRINGRFVKQSPVYLPISSIQCKAGSQVPKPVCHSTISSSAVYP